MRTSDKRRFVYFPTLSGLCLVVFSVADCQAATRLFGPARYLSEADSPFDLSELGTSFFLEDFEDSELNTPGLSPIGVLIRMPGSSTDSVDGDDGNVNGDGTLGSSLEPSFTLCNHGVDASCWWSFGLNFDPVFDGQLPNAVGFVVTDSAIREDITLTFYDDHGDVIAITTESGLGDSLDNGGTDEDRFLGLANAGGISTLWIRSAQRFEIDHLQYGNLPAVLCDFSGDGLCDGADINMMMNEAATGGNETDLTTDGIVNNADRDMWLSLAGSENGFGGSLLVGDSNLDGEVNAADLNNLAKTWQSRSVFDWTRGNYSVDGSLGVNSGDLNALAVNWQRSSLLAATAVPESNAKLPLALVFVIGFYRRNIG